MSGTGAEPRPLLIAVVGPTGSGKSQLGLELAESLGGEIINADSMQFYRGMDIGTAKLPVSERRGIPHYLLDVLDIHQEASVARFQQQAREHIADIQDRGLHPILVGGSGLYVRAALDVLDFPGTDPAVRKRLETELAAHGSATLKQRLLESDPISAARISDDKRLVRALEVLEVTGRPFSSFMPQRQYFQPSLQLALNGDRAELHERLARRVYQMLELGLRAEVAALAERGLREAKTASLALGYQQFLRNLDEPSYREEQATEDTIVATRQFARRQLTWFRADPRVQWLNWADPRLTTRARELVQSAQLAMS
ncbi:tRNA (adenosine(37)-N6)-dimethylallyltransferase MiaA [Psychromicrobium lacuslunae]|uniref:tRNA dimethylallyltransferase n=1 Tax=Psychromicrobium lacuslunae TaxID=1618207 RepID=A0A0D4BWW3_9MICC|nr:tRNA (adenosine(37)-N6)-dimethylallyltransferase MiaA [Psychromicrobium lacuslunae]AJT40591.1 tRNA delta(2)-isopentenylpyrophosphate transferase [Psychromicrobium lacuslunae]